MCVSTHVLFIIMLRQQVQARTVLGKLEFAVSIVLRVCCLLSSLGKLWKVEAASRGCCSTGCVCRSHRLKSSLHHGGAVGGKGWGAEAGCGG